MIRVPRGWFMPPGPRDRSSHDWGVFRGRQAHAVDAPRGVRETRDLHKLFGRKGHTEQGRQGVVRRSSRDARVRRISLKPCRLKALDDQRIQRWVHALDALDMCLEDLSCRDLALPDTRREDRRWHLNQFAHT